MLSQNKKAWDSHLKYAVCVDWVRINRSIVTYMFQLVYGLEAIFPIQIILLLMNLLQYQEVEEDDMQIRISQLIELQQVRDRVQIKSQEHQERVK